MNERVMQAFFEIHQDLPREGPGSTESTKRALSLLTDLPRRPPILDIGCGPGMQTLDLTRLTAGHIVAVDNHQPYLNQLAMKAARQGIADRIVTTNADMAALDFPEGSFDLIWAEGSAYLMGFELALGTWRPLLRRPGCLAATEITWTAPHAPAGLRRFWDSEYPEMQDTESNPFFNEVGPDRVLSKSGSDGELGLVRRIGAGCESIYVVEEAETRIFSNLSNHMQKEIHNPANPFLAWGFG